MKYIDIHTHSVYSDGRLEISELLQKAQTEGLSVYSITDHNAVGAYDDIQEYRHLFDGKIIPAVELSTSWKGEVIEVLGYGIDSQQMGELIKKNYPYRGDNDPFVIRHDINTLLSHGVILSDPFIETITTSPHLLYDTSRLPSRICILEEMKRHPENAVFFKSKQEFLNIKEGPFARQYIFNPESTLYIDRSFTVPDYDTAIEMIHKTGGLAFLAHPLLFSKRVTEHLSDFYGLEGMECHYGTFTAEQKKQMCEFCDTHALYKSGGSDFHGLQMRPQNIFARSGGQKIKHSLIEPWIDKIKVL